MAKFTKVHRDEFPSTDPGRIGKTDVSYVYMNMETFSTINFSIPLEEDTDERVAEVVRERATRSLLAGPAEIEIES